MARWRLAGVLCAVVLLSGCTSLGYQPGPNEAELFSELDANEELDSSVVDFAELIPGDWEFMVIVCHGGKTDEVNETLGFTWSEMPNVERAGFGTMAIFASSERVVTQLGPKRNESGSDATWSVCTPTLLGGASGPEPLRVDREDATIRFMYNDYSFGLDVWYIPEDETERLREGSRG